MNRRKFLKRAFGGAVAVVAGVVAVGTKSKKETVPLVSTLPKTQTYGIDYYFEDEFASEGERESFYGIGELIEERAWSTPFGTDGENIIMFNKSVPQATRECFKKVYLVDNGSIEKNQVIYFKNRRIEGIQTHL